MNQMVKVWSHELDYLRAVKRAAQDLIDNSPHGDDDKPYASEIVQGEFKALAFALTEDYWSKP